MEITQSGRDYLSSIRFHRIDSDVATRVAASDHQDSLAFEDRRVAIRSGMHELAGTLTRNLGLTDGADHDLTGLDDLESKVAGHGLLVLSHQAVVEEADHEAV